LLELLGDFRSSERIGMLEVDSFARGFTGGFGEGGVEALANGD
jgi:hypothetical protein